MQRLRRTLTLLVLGLMLAMALKANGKLAGRGAHKRFISKKYGFTISVPVGWLVDPAKDTPIFFSFSPAASGDFNRQLRLPKGGAVISIVAREDTPGLRSSTLLEWAAEDARGVAARRASVRELKVPLSTGIIEAILSSYDSAVFGPQDQSEHHVTVFWKLGHGLFASHLLYVANDQKGPEFEKLLLENVNTIRTVYRSERK